MDTTETPRSETEGAGTTATEMIQCPGCELMLPRDDLRAQMEHMETYHLDIIQARLNGS